MRIDITLPDDVANELKKMATGSGRSRKKYIEQILIKYIKSKKTK